MGRQDDTHGDLVSDGGGPTANYGKAGVVLGGTR
jgi:hypothetical protein